MKMTRIYTSSDDMVNDCLARAAKRVDVGVPPGRLDSRPQQVYTMAVLIALSELFMAERHNEH